MTVEFHAPAMHAAPADLRLRATRAAGHLAAAAFVAAVAFISLQVMAFAPPAEASCLPEICSAS